MTKILLVEDDNNLREIYEARLAAEGYDIVTAPDGEAALAMAAREHPDLVITDVMMPKISGFEMLDILRNTEALRDVKVIMLTALGQAEDNARAGALGADRYLVKSQVTLEDIVKAAHEVIEGLPANSSDEAIAAAEAAPAATEQPAAADQPGATYQAAPAAIAGIALPPADDVVGPDLDDPSSLGVPAYAGQQPDEASYTQPEPVQADQAELAQFPEPAAQDTPAELPNPTLSDSPVFQDGPTSTDLLDETPAPAEASYSQPEPANVQAVAQPAASEESDIRNQIDQFLTTNADTPAPAADQPAEPALAEAPEEELARDDATPDLGQLSVQEPEPTRYAAEQPEPADVQTVTEPTPLQTAEPAAQYQTVATETEPLPAPDLVAAAIPAPEAVINTTPPTATPGYPSQPFVMPTTVPQPVAAQPAPAPEPAAQQPQTESEKLMSEAVDTMIGAAPVAAGQTVDSPTVPVGGPQEPVARKKVIEPLPSAEKPDINQLLAMEDAKVAAGQAAQTVQQAPQPNTMAVQPAPPLQAAPAAATQSAPMPAPSSAQQPGQAPQLPGQQPGQPPLDPNSVAL